MKLIQKQTKKLIYKIEKIHKLQKTTLKNKDKERIEKDIRKINTLSKEISKINKENTEKMNNLITAIKLCKPNPNKYFKQVF